LKTKQALQICQENRFC